MERGQSAGPASSRRPRDHDVVLLQSWNPKMYAVTDTTRICLYIVTADTEAAAIQAVLNDQWSEQLDADNVTDASALTAVFYSEVKRIE